MTLKHNQMIALNHHSHLQTLASMYVVKIHKQNCFSIETQTRGKKFQNAKVGVLFQVLRLRAPQPLI